jgi:hypothetical protein
VGQRTLAAEPERQELCFVIGPIGEVGTEFRRHADWLLKGIIQPVFNQHFPEFKVERADEIKAAGNISSQIITRLTEAKLVIADMSLHNANAFYELAVRHFVRLPTIHMILKGWNIPFDVAPYRAIEFSLSDYDGLEAARKDLKETIEEVIKPGFVVETPISHAAGILDLRKHATPAEQVLADELVTMRGRLDRLERELVSLMTNAALGLRPPLSGPLSYLSTMYDASTGTPIALQAVGIATGSPIIGRPPLRGGGAIGEAGELFQVPMKPKPGTDKGK